MRHAQEQLQLQRSAEEIFNNSNSQNGNTELLKRNKIEGTPFYIIGNDDIGYFLTLGKHRLTENYKTEKEVENCLTTDRWDIIIKLVLSVHNMLTETLIENEELKKIQKQDF